MKKEKKVKSTPLSRKFSFRTLSIISIAVALAITILLNVFIQLIVEKYPNTKIDLTSTNTYTLQDDTINYLTQNTTPIDIYVLCEETVFENALGGYDEGHCFIQAKNLLDKMVSVNDKIYSLEYINTTKDPTFTSQYSNIDWTSTNQNNLILIDAGDDNYTTLTMEECFTYDSDYLSYEGVYYFTNTNIEQAIVTGILTLTTDDKVEVNYITGAGQEVSYYNSVVTLLKQNAYEVNEVSIYTDDLSEDASIAILWAPTVDLSEEAVEKIDAWLNNNGAYGRTLIYFPHYEQVKTPNLDALFAQYGMKISDGLAFTTNSSYYYGQYDIFMVDYTSDVYTASLKNPNVPVLFAYSRGVEVLDENVATTILNVPSGAGVYPYDAESDDITDYIDADGVDVAAVGTKTNDESVSSNIAIFGSGNMILSAYISEPYVNNANYIVNFCNTVTNRGDMGIVISSSSTNTGSIEMLPTSTKIVYYVLFVGVIPGLVLVAGVVVFIRRRFK